MRVAVVGSRGFANMAKVAEFIRGLAAKHPDAVVVSGGAQGVDTEAAYVARACGLQVVEHLPDWNKHGRGAGLIRNTTIIEDADVVVAFWDQKSKRTQDSIRKAEAAGKKVHVVFP